MSTKYIIGTSMMVILALAILAPVILIIVDMVGYRITFILICSMIFATGWVFIAAKLISSDEPPETPPPPRIRQ